MRLKIGQGIDFHQLQAGLDLWLGGIKIPSERGCVAHSDGDVLIHAICDAMLGAAGLKDIGYYFPDNDDTYKGIDSKILLARTNEIIGKEGYVIGNIDCTLCIEKPKIAPFIDDMRAKLASVLDIETSAVSVKATTTEKMGFVGNSEGVVALAVVMLCQ